MNFDSFAARIQEEMEELSHLCSDVEGQLYLIEKLKDPAYVEKLAEFSAEVEEKFAELQSPENQIRRGIENIGSKVSAYYTGAERVFTTVVKYIDKENVKGKNWHQELIEQVSVAKPPRPAVISEFSKDVLTDLRGFRNVERAKAKPSSRRFDDDLPHSRLHYPSFLEEPRTLEHGRMLSILHPRLETEISQFLDLVKANSLVGGDKNLEAERQKVVNRGLYKSYFEKVSPPSRPSVGIFTKWDNQEKTDIAIAKMILSENQGDSKQGENRVRQILSQGDRVLELIQGKDRSRVGNYINAIIHKAASDSRMQQGGEGRDDNEGR